MKDSQSILYISHPQQRCGVHQFGRRIAMALAKSQKFRFMYCEVTNASDLADWVAKERPSAMIYNYHPATLPWLSERTTRRFGVPQIGTIHEVTQSVADNANSLFFDYHIAPDPTLLRRNPIVFKTGRLVPLFLNELAMPEIPTFGSFGFGTDGKGVEYLVASVQENYDVAEIRLQLSPADFGDTNGTSVRSIVKRCRSLIYKKGIILTANHDFLSELELLKFLAENTCNIFTYNQMEGRGISSVTDYALGVDRPVAIRRTPMMRHLLDISPSICLEDRSLRDIVISGTKAIRDRANQWCESNLIWEYERIISQVLARRKPAATFSFRGAFNWIKCRVKRKKYNRFQEASTQFHWIAPGPLSVDRIAQQALVDTESYIPVDLPPSSCWNRILDDTAREIYGYTISKLFRWFPDLMARKIPEANVQQAFALDTLIRIVGPPSERVRMLCVGSFEDSSAYGIKRLGYALEEVDPVLNYDLTDFCERPTTQLGSYDAVFSVSVIEHVEHDEMFLAQMASLLRPGGILLLTADFLNTWKPGDPKPTCDFRLYTETDFTGRLLSQVPDCELVGSHAWSNTRPDFIWDGIQYSFASLVLKKKK